MVATKPAILLATAVFFEKDSGRRFEADRGTRFQHFLLGAQNHASRPQEPRMSEHVSDEAPVPVLGMPSVPCFHADDRCVDLGGRLWWR